MLFTLRFELGIVNVDIVLGLALMLMVGLRVGMGCVGFRCRVARRREFINSGLGGISKNQPLGCFTMIWFVGVLDTARTCGCSLFSMLLL